MKYSSTLIFLFFIIFQYSALGQSTRMNNAVNGRTFTSENQLNTVQPLLLKAERQFRTFDYEETFLTLESAVSQNPNVAEPLVMRARFRRVVGMQYEAAQDIERANSLNPYAADAYGYNGKSGLVKVMAVAPEKALIEYSDFQRMNYYYDALDRNISDSLARIGVVNDIALVLDDVENERFDTALVLLDTLIENYPELSLVYDLKGLVLQQLGEKEEAYKVVARALELDPECSLAWYNHAQIKNNQGDFQTAKESLDKAIALQKDMVKAYFYRALLLKKMGENEEALEDYESLADLQAETPAEIILNRGLTKKMMGDYEGAWFDLNRAIEELPEDPILFKNRANLNLLTGMPLKAIDDYTTAIRLDDQYAEAYFNRAICHLQLYDKISACADLERSGELGLEKGEELYKYFCTQY
jgi:tetratricopeptide (TPR) repeat protein